MVAIRSVLAILLLALSWSIAAAQQVTRYRITGEIADSATGRPLEGAAVVIVGTTIGIPTDAGGRFSLVAHLPSGARILRVRRMGFDARDTRIVLPPDGDSLHVGRIPLAASLPTLTGAPGAPVCTFVGARPPGVDSVGPRESTDRRWTWVQEVEDPAGVRRLLHCRRLPGM